MTKPSPSFALSLLALFVALGGTGYAAIQFPKASIGGKQLKKNAVSSAKVRNGALRLRDFKASERSRLRGAAGARGDRGSAASPARRGFAARRGFREWRACRATQGSRVTRAFRATRDLPGIQGNTGVEQVVVRTTAFVFALSTEPARSSPTMSSAQPGESVVGGGDRRLPWLSRLRNQPSTLVTRQPAEDVNGAGHLRVEALPAGWFAEAGRNSDVFIQIVTVYVLCASSA